MKVSVDLSQVPMPKEQGKASSLLYNGMISPLLPFAIRGAIWYQGESNVSRAFQYRTSFPNMIKNWREDWGQGDFPFYFVQIAPFTYNANDSGAELREAQALTVGALPNVGMAVTMDVVPNLGDIHPPYKQEVGDRLARLALNLTYGKRDVVCFGPTFKSAKFDGGRAVVRFDHAQGLTISGDKLSGIELAGEDKVFHPAEAKIEGESLIVTSAAVEKPVAVRLGFRDAVLTNLFNGAGLPAPPFRSDDWPGVTVGVKW
jgi:sialate O-acetylesterase